MITRQEINEAACDMDLLRRLAQDVVPVRPAGFGVTVGEYAVTIGMTYKPAKKVLLHMVKNGELAETTMRHNGRPVTIYYEPEDESDE